MQNEPFTPEEQMLIARLKDAPQPRLKPQAMDAIRAQLFAEMDVPVKPFWQTTVGMTSIAVVTTIIIIVIIIIGVSVSGSDDEEPTVGPNPSESPTIETVLPTETIDITTTPETTTPDTPDSTETPDSPTPQPTATTAASSGAPILVIEGPVSTININTITVFDLTIQVDAGNPILTQLQIGDRVRIDGQTSVDGTTIIIVAVNITIIHTQIIVEPGGGGLPANCKMTKNGKITCKDTRRTSRD